MSEDKEKTASILHAQEPEDSKVSAEETTDIPHPAPSEAEPPSSELDEPSSDSPAQTVAQPTDDAPEPSEESKVSEEETRSETVPPTEVSPSLPVSPMAEAETTGPSKEEYGESPDTPEAEAAGAAEPPIEENGPTASTDAPSEAPEAEEPSEEEVAPVD